MSAAEQREAYLASVAGSMDGPVSTPVVVGSIIRPLANLGTFDQYASNPIKRATVKRQNSVGRPLLLCCPVGVIAAPGQNGHMYLEIAGPEATVGATPPDANFYPTGEVGMRNNQAAGTGGAGHTGGTPNLAPSASLYGIIPVNGWYRLRTEQINGYNEPSWVYIGAPSFQIL